MARRTDARKPRLSKNDQPDPALLEHIQALGLVTVEDYQQWCGRHGFSRRTNKHWRQRLKERTFATRAAADARLARKKHELRRPEHVIERIFRGEVPEQAVTQPRLAAICRAYTTTKNCRNSQRSLLRLLLHVSKYTDLISIEPAVAALGWQAGNSFVEALVALARQWTGWLRPVEDWRPRTHNTRRQFSSLARHLFARWPVPAFMDSVWFKGNTREAVRQQKWFLHLGRGENIRTAALPLPYTKRMAHYFVQAPSDLSVEQALRWGQIYALGGNERLVRVVIATRLGREFEHEDFWTSVIGWLIAHPMLDPAHVGPIIDYLRDQRFISHDVFVAPGLVERRAPPQPNLTMKGRTPESLLRQVEGWHGRLARAQQPAAEWPPSGIAAFEFVEGSERGGNLKIWTITELVSTKALVAEGRTMKHCVATYARSCSRGFSSIWTLEVDSFEGRRKILTVEVDHATKLIRQARGKCNAPPGDKHRGILRRWALEAGLGLASYV